MNLNELLRNLQVKDARWYCKLTAIYNAVESEWRYRKTMKNEASVHNIGVDIVAENDPRTGSEKRLLEKTPILIDFDTILVRTEANWSCYQTPPPAKQPA